VKTSLIYGPFNADRILHELSFNINFYETSNGTIYQASIFGAL